MPYLLDTDIVILYLGGDMGANRLVRALVPEEVSISVVTYMEVSEGVISNVLQKDAALAFEQFLTDIPAIPFTRDDADVCAQIRRNLRRDGRSVRRRALDLMIAATAMGRGFTLVTRNTSDYGDIEGLELLRGP